MTAEEQKRIAEIYARRDADEKSARYSHFDAGNLFNLQALERKLLRVLGGLEGKTILDVGCGKGLWLRQFVNWGAAPNLLSGIDLLPHRIEFAKRTLPAAVHLACASATEMPFADASLELVVQSTTFSSIPRLESRKLAAAEMVRVLKPGGRIIWYDLFRHNPANPEVHPIRRSQIVSLFPNCRIELERVTLAPPLARALAPVSWMLASSIAGLRVANVCYLGTVQPK